MPRLVGGKHHLSCDDAAALVLFTGEGALTVIDGDERIVASGILGGIACILTTIATMIYDIVMAALSLTIPAILQAVLNGVSGILTCIFQILI